MRTLRALGVVVLLLAWPSAASAQSERLVLLASAARTADSFTPEFASPGWARGMHVVVNTTAGSGYSIRPLLQARNPAAAPPLNWVTIVDDIGPNITTNRNWCSQVYPADTNQGGGQCLEPNSSPLPQAAIPASAMRLALDHLDATSVTYSVSIVWLR